LISYALWQNRFGRDRNILERTISLNGQPLRVLGVLPRDFEFPTLAHVDLLVPEALDESIVARHVMGPVVRVFARMKPGSNIEQSKAELQPLFNDFVQSAPPPFRKVLRLQVRSIRDLQVHDSRSAAWLLLLSALSVLLIGCANAANLVLARGLARRQELAVRSALGAARLRLFRQRLTESVLLALAGGLAGVGLAYGIVRLFVALAPAGVLHLAEATIDVRVLCFATVISLFSGILFGTAPALERPLQLSTLTAVSASRRAHLRQMLLFAQVSLAVVLLGSALLLVRSLRNLETEPLGMNTENIVTGQITLGELRFPSPAQRLNFYEELESKLRDLPGTRSAALADSLPPAPPARTMPFVALQGEGQTPLGPDQGIGGVVGWRSVTPGYFSTLGIPLIRGRAFDEQDRAAGTHSIILNHALAQRLFAREEALGKTVQFHTDRTELSGPFTVIGITGNTQNQGLGGNARPEYYMVRIHSANDVIFGYPDSQRVNLVVRSAVGSQTVAQEMRNAVAALDPTLPVELSTMSESVARLAERPRFSTALLSLFAVVGMLLTALGIYGVVTLLVSQRSEEIGIRMALGAAQKDVVRMMVWEASRWIAGGAAAGILCSLLVSRWIGSLLFNVSASDPATLAEAAGLLLLIAMIGAYIPARRAAKIDPMVALRYE
jgi:putative ABC transport system permease protein